MLCCNCFLFLGGRRRGTGPASRATGTIRKKRQALEKAQGLASQIAQGVSSATAPTNTTFWGGQPAPQNPPMGYMSAQQGRSLAFKEHCLLRYCFNMQQLQYIYA